MTPQNPLFATIDALRAHVAVLDSEGAIIAVNDRWRRFGRHRDAQSDYVRFNYLDVCAKAAANGDIDARRVEDGLRRLLTGKSENFWHTYRCSERIFRMTARHLNDPVGGAIIAHEDITPLLRAKQERDHSRRLLSDKEQDHAELLNDVHEELGQRLTAISLAARALDLGGDRENAIALIYMAVDEARHELKRLRYQDPGQAS